MDLGLAGAGEGAGSALERLIAQRIQQQQFQAQLEQRNQEFQLRQQELAQRDRETAEARRQASQDRQSAINLRRLQSLAPGTDVSPETFKSLTNPETGAAFPEQFTHSPGTAASLPSTSFAGLQPLNGGSGAMNISQTLSQAIPEKYKFGGTAEQLAKQREDQQKSSDSDRRAADAEQRMQAAWERLRVEGDNANTRAALGQANLQLQQAKLEMERAKSEAASARTPQPQFFQDENQKWHAVLFDKGTFKEIPLPQGFVPTNKAQAPGSFMTFLRGLNPFGGGSSTPSAPAYLSTDPNAGVHP